MRTQRLEIYKLDRSGFAELLERFERAYAGEAGEALPSAEFYERYLRGEMEGTAAIAWASFYEAYLRAPERVKGSCRPAEIADLLVPRFERPST
jgi:hypothetical protein